MIHSELHRRIFAYVLGGAIVGIVALSCMSPRSEHYRLEEAMARHGLTAGNIVYGRVNAQPVHIEINAPRGIVRPYYSLSKPMTAAVALQILDVEEVIAGATVKQLLQHTGGYDRAMVGDPVTEGDENSTCTRIPVPEKQFPPGARYAYSNLGYCLIGRAIEEKTGSAFPEVVRALFYEAHAMQYDPRLGPAGGWAGTAEDFFHFALRPVNIATSESPRSRSDDIPYGLGWAVGPDYLAHYGALNSNFAIAVKQAGFSAVGLFDGRPPDDGSAAKELRKILLQFNKPSRAGA